MAAFRHMGDTKAGNPVGGQGGELVAVKTDAASRARNEPRDRSQQRALASGVRTDDADELTLADGEIDVVQDIAGIVSGGKLVDGEQGRSQVVLSPA